MNATTECTGHLLPKMKSKEKVRNCILIHSFVHSFIHSQIQIHHFQCITVSNFKTQDEFKVFMLSNDADYNSILSITMQFFFTLQ